MTQTLDVAAIAIALAGLMISVMFVFLFRESKRSHYNEDRHRSELEVIRKSLEEQLYRINSRLVATEERWRDVNHLLISAQKLAPPLDALPFEPRSQFLDSAGVTNTTLDRKLVFVLTPFHPDYEPTYETIRSVCQAIGLKCLRGDEEHVSGDIFRHILQLIAQSRLIIANLDGRNPNVFYELGIAYALGKPVLLLASTQQDLPFDVRTARIVFWQALNDLRQKLRDELLKAFVAEK